MRAGSQVRRGWPSGSGPFAQDLAIGAGSPSGPTLLFRIAAIGMQNVGPEALPQNVDRASVAA
ncbi:DUF6053 domain-containing protein [Lysobacter enzymogenes]|uniref:DUF6053 domain-containing protein n=1 Tax=Lysobacter enzymogenes TaxID=69 RepID=UPI003D2F59B6